MFKTSGYNVEWDELWDRSNRSLPVIKKMATSQAEKDARRRKIRELESSLFNNEWTSEKTDLPQLKNVDEYSTRYGNAEPAQNQPRPKSIKQVKRPTSIFKMRKKSKDAKEFDKIPLIQAKICLTGDTIRRIDIVSRCFENKNNNC